MACLTDAQLAELTTDTASLSPEHQQHLMTCEKCRAALLGAFRAQARTLDETLPAEKVDGVSAKNDVPTSTGRYLVVEKDGKPELLGRGGYGKVLLARDAAVGRDVALKCLRSTVLASTRREQSEARLLREARVVGQLEHPAIVPLYDVGRTDDGQLFYTMRRIRGRTLAEAVETAYDFTARLRLLPHVLTACHAVAYAHSRGVIHRDLKPQNVMVDRFGQTAVIDWGLASTAGAVDTPEAPETSSGLRLVGDGQTISDGKGRLGTPAYMSPEQLTGVHGLVDEKSDVWGLGAMLFEVLTGRSPREEGPLHQPPPPVRKLVPECPSDLAALCDKALAESRDDRYPSAEALALDLDAWLHGREVTAHVYRPRELIRRFVLEHRVVLSVATISLLLLVSLSVGAFLRVRDERNRAREFGLAMLNDVLPRMTSLGDDAFLNRFTNRVQEWLDASGTSTEDSDVGRAWFHLSLQAEALGDEKKARLYAERCMTLIPALRPERRYPLEQGCGVLVNDHGGLPDPKAMAAAIEVLWKTPVPEALRTDPATLEARQQVASRRVWHANLRGDSALEGLAGRDTVALARQWKSLEPTEPMARFALGDALSAAAIAAVNQHQPAAALALSEEAVAESRVVLSMTRNEQALARLSDSLLVEVTSRHWFANDAVHVARLADEARQLFAAQRLLTHDATPSRIGLLQLEFEMGALDALGPLIDTFDAHHLEANAFGLWLFCMVASGRGAAVMADPALYDRHAEYLDSALGLTLAAADSGAYAQAAKWARHAASLHTGSIWGIGAMERWAKSRTGPAAELLQRFEAKMTESLRKSDDELTSSALLELAEGLEKLAP